MNSRRTAIPQQRLKLPATPRPCNLPKLPNPSQSSQPQQQELAEAVEQHQLAEVEAAELAEAELAAVAEAEDVAVEARAEAVEEAPLADPPSHTATRMAPAITPPPSA